MLAARNTDFITARARKIKRSVCMLVSARKCLQGPSIWVSNSLSIDFSFSRVSAANFRRTTRYTRKQITQRTANETLLSVCNYVEGNITQFSSSTWWIENTELLLSSTSENVLSKTPVFYPNKSSSRSSYLPLCLSVPHGANSPLINIDICDSWSKRTLVKPRKIRSDTRNQNQKTHPTAIAGAKGHSQG